MIDDLYSKAILRLVADIPRVGRLPAPDGAAERVSKLCGSKVWVEVNVKDGVVTDFAQTPKACALGQASAAVLGAHVVGASLAEVVQARDDLRGLLTSGAPVRPGRFEALNILAPVKDFPARHASTLLPFDACVAALEAAIQV